MDLRLLFDELVTLSPGERLARLDQLDVGDSLRRSVLSLLRYGGTCWFDRPLPEQSWFQLEQQGGEPAVADGMPGPTARLGPFRLIGLLGRGATSVVWLGERSDPLRRVAVKQLLRPRVTDLNGWLQRECEAQARVDDPGLARLLDAGLESDGTAWIAMDHVDGLPITAWCEKFALDVRGRVTLVAELASVVAAAHAAGVLHRDLKPANVLVDGAGRVRVLDFGLAVLDGSRPDMPEGCIAGTLSYMAPEQAAGRTDLDVRVDVHGLGAVLHELLTGRPPLALEGLLPWEALQSVRELEPEPLDASLGDLGAVVARALARDRGERYPTATAMRQDLVRWLEHRRVLARRAGPSHVLRLAVRRNPLAARAIAAGVLVLAAGATFALLQLLKVEREAGLATIARDRWALLADGFSLDEIEEQAAKLWPAAPDRLPELQAALARLDALLARHASGAAPAQQPADAAEVWRAEQESLLSDRLQATRDSQDGLRAGLAARVAYAEGVERATLVEPAAAWASACADVAADPRFAGAVVPPQCGLIPLGPDPISRLQEFALWGFGSVPRRDDAGNLVSTGEPTPVLVLIPGGDCRLGCQTDDPDAPRFDPLAERHEVADVHVSLAPYFLGKYELSRAQWGALGGAPLPEMKATTLVATTWIGTHYPATDMPWREASSLLARHELLLPTEAQWEFAARAGSDTPWWFGTDPALAAVAGNVCDASRRGDCGSRRLEVNFNDGFEALAPVDAGLPNGFGLFGLVGNAAEMCSDVYLTSYRGTLREGDGLHEPDADEPDLSRRSLRGGSALDPVDAARSGARADTTIDQTAGYSGIRLVLPVLPAPDHGA